MCPLFIPGTHVLFSFMTPVSFSLEDLSFIIYHDLAIFEEYKAVYLVEYFLVLLSDIFSQLNSENACLIGIAQSWCWVCLNYVL